MTRTKIAGTKEKNPVQSRAASKDLKKWGGDRNNLVDRAYGVVEGN